ncbi:MAG: 1-acyl-sn-glycerol-3-phosphate acyltransferase [Pedosphaera sp.]|nr:1-acyl-sn-glycerol-3-phosphate acyltransferase [Pedosphaera sp.]
MRKLGRFTWRSLWLGAELLFLGLRFAFLFGRTLGRPSVRARAVCLHHGARRILRTFVDEVTVTGPRPASGLLVSNHLSYLDILLLGSLGPAVFVSKNEVKHWQVFGWFARLGGTVFVQRERRGHVGEISAHLHALLDAGELVILFPEGTSSGGETVLPFNSALLEPAVGQKTPLCAACIGYSLADGVVADDVCYWRDMTFLPHFVNLLRKQFVKARVNFAEVREPATDRKALARQLQSEVLRLKSPAPGGASPT